MVQAGEPVGATSVEFGGGRQPVDLGPRPVARLRKGVTARLIVFMATTTTSSDRRLFTMKTASGASTTELLSTAYSYSFLEMSPGIFRDGFESGDTGAWSVTMP